MNRFALFLVVGAVMQGLMTTANAVILPPTDDTSGTLTYNKANPPVVTKRTLTSANGSSGSLPVSKTRTAFMRFAVEETGMTAGTVEKARLTLYFPSVRKAGDLSLHVVTQDWDENFPLPERSRVHPAFEEVPFLTIPATSVVRRQFVIVDVTEQVRAALASPGTRFGFAVTSPDGIGNVAIGAKEGSASGYPPLLEMEGTGATSENTANAIVKRDGDGNFMVGTITGALVGNATSATTAGSATDFTGVLAGDVTGTQGATVVGAVGGVSAANVVSGANLANAATAANVPNTLVKRDGSGVVTATAFVGNGSGLTSIPSSSIQAPPPGMVLVPGGDFTFGDTLDGMTDAEPVATVISAFYIDTTEVTLSQWRAVYNWARLVGGYTFENTGSGRGDNYPVQSINWYDAVKWCNARSELAGKTPAYYTDDNHETIYRTGAVDLSNERVRWSANGYRLPTEAEWEKAARGGLVGQRFPWGNTISQKSANYTSSGVNSGESYDLGPTGMNPLGVNGSSAGTSLVGTFQPNGYGLFDMAGNVWEFCWDKHGTPYSGGIDPRGPSAGSIRTMRGGSFGGLALYLKCAHRSGALPANSSNNLGFRTVLPVGQ